jgi:hypothetical protein
MPLESAAGSDSLAGGLAVPVVEVESKLRKEEVNARRWCTFTLNGAVFCRDAMRSQLGLHLSASSMSWVFLHFGHLIGFEPRCSISFATASREKVCPQPGRITGWFGPSSSKSSVDTLQRFSPAEQKVDCLCKTAGPTVYMRSAQTVVVLISPAPAIYD